MQAGARAVGEIAKFLIEEGQDKVLVKHLKHELLRQTLPAESLIWICRQRHDASKPLFGLPVGIAMLSLIEQDHMDGGPNRMLRLKNRLKSRVLKEPLGRRQKKGVYPLSPRSLKPPFFFGKGRFFIVDGPDPRYFAGLGFIASSIEAALDHGRPAKGYSSCVTDTGVS